MANVQHLQHHPKLIHRPSLTQRIQHAIGCGGPGPSALVSQSAFRSPALRPDEVELAAPEIEALATSPATPAGNSSSLPRLQVRYATARRA